ncbi:hypothetical protein K432DRAFT_439938 [Lepidopterella palustris CBS 459.81]|uniref:Fungal N-terminal domain-containing protein n=1 Tax=Lepidopterella palustris CBS 459.81 TaxID=1314670 RepID=A0A8E2EIE5_9PEZI|nr:hypothetical protein K432DRAFT_439938 [Lepidopterella palustris CBS 459.81]
MADPLSAFASAITVGALGVRAWEILSGLRGHGEELIRLGREATQLGHYTKFVVDQATQVTDSLESFKMTLDDGSSCNPVEYCGQQIETIHEKLKVLLDSCESQSKLEAVKKFLNHPKLLEKFAKQPFIKRLSRVSYLFKREEILSLLQEIERANSALHILMDVANFKDYDSLVEEVKTLNANFQTAVGSWHNERSKQISNTEAQPRKQPHSRSRAQTSKRNQRIMNPFKRPEKRRDNDFKSIHSIGSSTSLDSHITEPDQRDSSEPMTAQELDELDGLYKKLQAEMGQEISESRIEKTTPVDPNFEDVSEPTQVDGEPTQADDEPTQVDVEPTQVDDEPTQVDDEPTQVDGEPTQVDDEPTEFANPTRITTMSDRDGSELGIGSEEASEGSDEDECSLPDSEPYDEILAVPPQKINPSQSTEFIKVTSSPKAHIMATINLEQCKHATGNRLSFCATYFNLTSEMFLLKERCNESCQHVVVESLEGETLLWKPPATIPVFSKDDGAESEDQNAADDVDMETTGLLLQLTVQCRLECTHTKVQDQDSRTVRCAIHDILRLSFGRLPVDDRVLVGTECKAILDTKLTLCATSFHVDECIFHVKERCLNGCNHIVFEVPERVNLTASLGLTDPGSHNIPEAEANGEDQTVNNQRADDQTADDQIVEEQARDSQTAAQREGRTIKLKERCVQCCTHTAVGDSDSATTRCAFATTLLIAPISENTAESTASEGERGNSSTISHYQSGRFLFSLLAILAALDTLEYNYNPTL